MHFIVGVQEIINDIDIIGMIEEVMKFEFTELLSLRQYIKEAAEKYFNIKTELENDGDIDIFYYTVVCGEYILCKET